MKTICTQYGVRECCCPESLFLSLHVSGVSQQPPNKKSRKEETYQAQAANVLALLKDMQVLLRKVPTGSFDTGTNNDIVRSMLNRKLTVSRDESDEVNRNSVLQKLFSMTCGISAVAALLVAFPSISGIEIKIGTENSILQYDNQVSKALSIFQTIGSRGMSEGNKQSGKEVVASSTIAVDGKEEEEEQEYDGTEVGETPTTTARKSNRSRESCASLFDLLNITTTKMGSRLLRRWLQHPLRVKLDILRRQNAVTLFVSNPILRNNLRDSSEYLRGFPDIESIG